MPLSARPAVLALLSLAAACKEHRSASVAIPVTVEPAPVVSRAPPDAAKVAVVTDWCIEGLTALDEETCYVLPPAAAGKPRRLLVYLHGIIPPVPASPQKENVMNAVLHVSQRVGAAALVPRGVRGVGPKGAHEWWAWPTSSGKYLELTPGLIARFAGAKKRLEAVAGAPFERTYVAGSSNGAYFLTTAAMRGDFDRHGLAVDGIGAMSGGGTGGHGPSSLAGRAPVPFYVGFGTLDEESTAHGRALAHVLEAARWPVKVSEHAFGHGAREVYLDEAFALWDAPR
jgi:predicted esterase